MTASPVLDDYVIFFETEPSQIHANGWYYGARFDVSRGQDELVVTVAPDNATFNLEWKQNGARRLHLNLTMVANCEIFKRGSVEYMQLRINTGPEALCCFDYCMIHLKPTINVELVMNWGPGWPPNSEFTQQTDKLHSNLPVR